MNKESIIEWLKNTESDLSKQAEEIDEALIYVRRCLSVLSVTIAAKELVETITEHAKNITTVNKIARKCKLCGKEFYPSGHGRTPQIFCSKVCNNKYHQIKRKTEKLNMAGTVNVDEKLTEYKNKYPQPAKRPNIIRDL